MKRSRLLALALVVLLVTPTVALGAVTGEPDLSVTLSDNRVSPGQTTALQLTVTNQGKLEDRSLRNPALNQRVTTARGLKVSLRSGDAPIDVETNTQSVGALPEGSSPALPFTVTVNEGAKPGTYRLPVRVSYVYSSNIDETRGVETEKEVTKRFTVTVRVVDESRFEVTDVASDVAIGDDGLVALRLTNVGTQTARDASVTLTSNNGQVTFSGAPTAQSYVGRWAPGETRTVRVKTSVASSAARRNFSLSAVVDYEDDDGVPTTSSNLAFGIVPDPEQTFAVENVESTLRVGQQGQLRGEIVNDGPNAARNVVVVFQPSNPTISPTETEYAVGTLGPGERASFNFDTEVTSNAEAGPRQFSLQVRYRNTDDQQRTSDPLDVHASVGKKRDEFSIEGVETTLTAGSNGQLRLKVTNNREEPLSDISAKLYTESPLSASDDEAFVSSLEPGESATVVFGVRAGGSALEKTYPVKVDFRYDDSDGETSITDTYQVPVQVNEPTQSGPPTTLVVGGVALLVVLLGGGYYLYSRR
ncbi:MAG: NEW3 domain-containing protein [Haloferacaceae archaeon]